MTKQINDGVRRILKNLKSFSLVEMITVIAIIAVLAVTGIFTLQKWISHSRDSRRLGDMATIKESLKVNYVDQDTPEMYPMPDKNNDGSEVTSGEINGEIVAYRGTFGSGVVDKISSMSTTPEEPFGKRYAYGITSNKEEFQVSAVLENGVRVSYLENIQNRAYAGEEESYVKGNYESMIKYTTGNCEENGKLLNIPSLIFNGTGEVNLMDTGTRYVVNKGKNYPYKISEDMKKNNRGIEEVFEKKTGRRGRISGFNITKIESKEDIKETLSAKTIDLFGGDVSKMYKRKDSECIKTSIDYCEMISGKGMSEVFDLIAGDDGMIIPGEIAPYIGCEVETEVSGSQERHVISGIGKDNKGVLLASKEGTNSLPASGPLSAGEFGANEEEIANNISEWSGEVVNGFSEEGGGDSGVGSGVIIGKTEDDGVAVESEVLPDAISIEGTPVLNERQLSTLQSKSSIDATNREGAEVRSYGGVSASSDGTSTSEGGVKKVVTEDDSGNISTISTDLPSEPSELEEGEDVNIYQVEYNKDKIQENEDKWAGTTVTGGVLEQELVIAGILGGGSDVLFVTQNEKSGDWGNSLIDCNGKGENWRLPSKGEMDIIETNKTKINEKGYTNLKDEVYWSSTENGCATAYGKDLSDGSDNGYEKTTTHNYRCVTSYNSYQRVDNVPSCISFGENTALTGTQTESSIEQVQNINQKVKVSVEGDDDPEYRICNDSSCTDDRTGWIQREGDVLSGEYVQMRMTSADTGGTTYTGKLNIGEETAIWELITPDSVPLGLKDGFRTNGTITTYQLGDGDDDRPTYDPEGVHYRGEDSWEGARNYCNNLEISVDGETYDDWEIPSIGELKDLYEHRGVIGCYPWSDGDGPTYWSSTTVGDYDQHKAYRGVDEYGDTHQGKCDPSWRSAGCHLWVHCVRDAE